jgi:hypothetical protein
MPEPTDGRRVTVQQSGVRFAYVILDPESGPWVSHYRYRSEDTARMHGEADLEWLRSEEAKDDAMKCPDGSRCLRSCRSTCWLAENVD